MVRSERFHDSWFEINRESLLLRMLFHRHRPLELDAVAGIKRGLPRDLPHRISEPTVAGNVFFGRSEEHTSELQSLMRISYAVFCLKKKTTTYSLIKKKIHNHSTIREPYNIQNTD